MTSRVLPAALLALAAASICYGTLPAPGDYQGRDGHPCATESPGCEV
jgi:hypothetical protein